jgi:nucleoside 2-deoxyribosyltransferase
MNPRVYLAGGFRSDWQQRVIDECDEGFTFFNPKEHGLEKSVDWYSTWDLHHVKNADIVFAYMERDNPSGYGLSLEVGYARAFGKTIILVDEKSAHSPTFDRYFKIVRFASNVVFDNLNEGICYLKAFRVNDKIFV